MRTPAPTLAFAFALAAFTSPAAAGTGGFGLDVLVNGSPRPELAARGTVYVEALRGHDYALRLSNPSGTRVAVALSVDGLNTIDAKHTSASDARKWVLAPYETVVIPGWQISNATSRKFVFTSEGGSYGAALGKTEDLGVIEAVFFRERLPYRVERRWKEENGRFSLNEKDRGPGAAPQAAPAEPSDRDHSQKSSSSSSSPVPAPSDEYAATGMGSQTRFGVTRVDLELEKEPAAVVRLRYEFRPQLIALGVLPRDPDSSRIARRERAQGFEEFCPEVR
jgi:hypothetical protein